MRVGARGLGSTHLSAAAPHAPPHLTHTDPRAALPAAGHVLLRREAQRCLADAAPPPTHPLAVVHTAALAIVRLASAHRAPPHVLAPAAAVAPPRRVLSRVELHPLRRRLGATPHAVHQVMPPLPLVAPPAAHAAANKATHRRLAAALTAVLAAALVIEPRARPVP